MLMLLCSVNQIQTGKVIYLHPLCLESMTNELLISEKSNICEGPKGALVGAKKLTWLAIEPAVQGLCDKTCAGNKSSLGCFTCG